MSKRIVRVIFEKSRDEIVHKLVRLGGGHRKVRRRYISLVLYEVYFYYHTLFKTLVRRRRIIWKKKERIVNLPFSIVLCMAFFPQMFIQNVSNEAFAKKRMKSNNVTKNPHFASHLITPFYNESPVVVEVKTRT